jgi:hypothetical protein
LQSFHFLLQLTKTFCNEIQFHRNKKNTWHDRQLIAATFLVVAIPSFSCNESHNDRNSQTTVAKKVHILQLVLKVVTTTIHNATSLLLSQYMVFHYNACATTFLVVAITSFFLQRKSWLSQRTKK